MRARISLCSLTLGAAAFAVAVNAAPRETAPAGKSSVRSDASRVVAGDQAHLRAIVDGGVADGALPYIRLTPVAGVGTADDANVDIDTVGGTMIVRIPPKRAYLEWRVDGWGTLPPGSNLLKTAQGQFNAAGLSSGAGAPLTHTNVACTTQADCAAALGASSNALTCMGGTTCENAYQNNTRADFPFGLTGISACNNIDNNRICGVTTLGADLADGAGEMYFGTLALEVPGGAAGTYTLGLLIDGTFIQDQNSSQPPLAKLGDATITIPTGRCCFGIGGAQEGCVEDVTAANCQGRPQPSLFDTPPGSTCADECAECLNNAMCNDNDACTTETCNTSTTQCIRGFIPGFDPLGPNCCDPANGTIAPRADADPCTTDTCSVNDATGRGVPQHDPAADGTGCDDDNPCTAEDACTGGLCNGNNVNGLACVDDTDCQFGGDTPGAVCEDGECSCTLEPDLTFEKIDPPAGNCYETGEKVAIAIHVGPAANIINGGQFAISYDNTCLDFVSISPAGAPYTNEIYEEVNEGAGTIFYAVGVELGGPQGNAGNSDMAIISFLKVGSCNSCNLCFTDVNPRHTYLTDNTGQPIGVNESCSKDINSDNDVTLDTPDNVKVNTGCNSAVAEVTWPAVSASSECGPATLVCTGEHLQSGTVWGMDRISDGGVFPIGDSNFCCTASEGDCGNSVEQCWTVTVNDETSLEVDIQLSPTMQTKPSGGLTRCIKFEVFNNCVQAPIVFEEDVLFGGLFDLVGQFTGAVKIPAAVKPECITARDQKHTLRSCYLVGDEDCDENGVLHAVFKQDPFFGGNWLIGGNLDGWKKSNPNASHDIIDILDFGSIVAEWMKSYDSNGDTIADGNTPCGVFPGNHADINGDGLVDPLDYSFISMNFLEDSKDCCCPGSSSLGNVVGRTEISVRELFENDMADLAVADLNSDGMVNLADMAALMQGVRPANKPADRGDGKNGTRTINRR